MLCLHIDGKEETMIKEIIVVEGKDDTAAIRRSVEAETIETGGSAINEEIMQKIILAQQRRGVIVFTDPDHAGERIRKLISARVPGCKHAFLTQEQAASKGDIGVENADSASIRKALEAVKTDYSEEDTAGVTEIDWNDLLEAGLIHHPQAAARRLKVGNILGIGYANGKQFYKRCAMFRIRLEEFMRALRQLDE